MRAFPMISIGNLPTFEDLHDLKAQGFNCLVSLSGSPFELIYGEEITAQFDLKEYEIPDLFSRDDIEEDQWQTFCDEYLDQLYDAIRCLGQHVSSGRYVHCFCHQGISRSSLVVAGALVSTFGMVVDDAVSIVKQKNRSARFFSRSYQVLRRIEHLSIKAAIDV